MAILKTFQTIQNSSEVRDLEAKPVLRFLMKSAQNMEVEGTFRRNVAVCCPLWLRIIFSLKCREGCLGFNLYNKV